MKHLLLITLLLLAVPLHATTYYANLLTSQNINYTTGGAGWYPIQGASCVATGTPVAVGSFANGDVLNANGCTGIAVNVDPGAATGASAGVCGTVTVTVTLTTDATNGGGFTYATATNIVIHANFTGSKTTALAITGSTGGGTICGNAQGGSTSSQYGVYDSHTSVTIYMVGNSTGGSASFCSGYNLVSSAAVNIVGNATAGSGGSADGLDTTGTVSMTGNCVGSSTATSRGCLITGGSLTLTGNIIDGKVGSGVYQYGGTLYYTPAAANYILTPKDSSYTLGVINSHSTVMPTDPGVTNVKSGVVYGPYTGTLSAGAPQGYAY